MRSLHRHATWLLVLGACSADPELAETGDTPGPSDGTADPSAGSTGDPVASSGDAADTTAAASTGTSAAQGSDDDGSTSDAAGSGTDSGAVPDCAFFSDDFASGDTSKAENGFSWNDRSFPVSQGFGHGDDHALRFEFGPDPAGDDSSAELRFELGRQVEEVWIELWVYYPTGDEGLGSARYEHRDDESSDNNKFLRLWRGEYDERPKVGASTLPTADGSGGGNSRMINEYNPIGSSMGGFGSGGSAWVTDDDPDTCHRGEWTRVRMYFSVSEPGASNGAARWWVGDTLVYEATDLPNDAEDPANNHLERGYLLGWANSGFTELTHVYVDDVSVCDVDPGS
jgi:hypothetical protein